MGRRQTWAAGVFAAGFSVAMWLAAAPRRPLLRLPDVFDHTLRRPPAELPGSTGRPKNLPELPDHTPPDPRVVVGMIMVLGLLAVGYVVHAYLRTRWDEPEPLTGRLLLRDPDDAEGRRAFTGDEALAAPPDGLLDDAERRRRLLRDSEVSRAIIDCWVALEDDAARAGVPPLPHETSTEYTQRVLGRWVRDEEPLLRLGSLYREARFSEHDLPESAREAAQAALAELAGELRRASEVPVDQP